LVQAGLTPAEVLAAATRDAARFLGRIGEFGTVEAGKRADLILLEADPSQDIGNVERRVGVMVRGRWISEPKIQRMLAGLVVQ
jgi:imidazolonepropionase-like amidohydrolase